MVYLRAKLRAASGAVIDRAGLARTRSAPDRPHVRLKKEKRANGLLLLSAFLWVFTQLIMSGFMAQSSVALADGLRVITICSGTELITITVDADGKPVEGSPTKTVSCPWCLQFSGIGPLPAPDPALFLPPCPRVYRVSVAELRQAAPCPSRTPYASRAPPELTSL